MIFGSALERFVESSGVTVMLRGLMENVFSPQWIDNVFAESATRQRPGELLFSTVVDLLSLVVTGVNKSVNAAYKVRKKHIGVSIKSVYNKLSKGDTEVAQALVRRSAEQLTEVVDSLKLVREPAFPGFRTKVLDGNHLPATEHRLGVLRETRCAPLPGQALCILEPDRMLMTDLFPCEDGHAQERSLLDQVLERLERKDLVIADRNFCTAGFLGGIIAKGAFFLIRQHAGLRHELIGKRRKVGDSETGPIYQQRMKLHLLSGGTVNIRRVTIVLKKPTEDGDTELHVLTNLPRSVNSMKVAEGYRRRWTVENAFQELAQALESEIRTLAYPKAALLAFSLAVVMYNLISTMKTALNKAHGETAAREKLSGYYLAEEIRTAYRGLTIAVPAVTWTKKFGGLTAVEMAKTLLQIAKLVCIEQFYKTTRGNKRTDPKKRTGDPRKHVSTYRLLEAAKAKRLAEC